MKKRLSLLASGLLLLAGCAMGPQTTSPGSGATLILTPEVVSAGYQTQDSPDLAPYNKDDVNHVIVKLFTVVDGQESPVMANDEPVTRTIPNSELDAPVTFTHLKAHTTYRAKCEAYISSPMPFYRVQAPPSEPLLISTQDAGSYTDIVVTNDDRPTVGKLKVKLKARPFRGGTDFSVVVENGGLTSGGPETMEKVAPELD